MNAQKMKSSIVENHQLLTIPSLISLVLLTRYYSNGVIFPEPVKIVVYLLSIIELLVGFVILLGILGITAMTVMTNSSKYDVDFDVKMELLIGPIGLALFSYSSMFVLYGFLPGEPLIAAYTAFVT